MNGLRLGKLFGISIHVDWSWLLIFILVSWSLNATFGQIHPEWAENVRWGMAMLAALLFFLSVLAHELAHSLAALSRGVPVHNITLFMFGGVSNIQREPASPAEELYITIVGPLTSLFLGAVFLVVGAGGFEIENGAVAVPAILSSLKPLNTILAWLGSVNIMVGFFNLIPAFPLDGGRIVRSMIWAITKDVRRATRIASVLGQGMAWTLIFAGTAMLFGVTIPFLGNGFFNGIWLIFIGWFLNNAASAGYQQVVMQDALTDVPVRRVMRTEIPMVSSDTSVGELVSGRLAEVEESAMLVTEGQNVVGMIAMSEARKSPEAGWMAKNVGEIMTPVSDLEYVTPDQDVAEAFDRLQRLEMRQIPVMVNDQIVGLLGRRDIARWLRLNSE